MNNSIDNSIQQNLSQALKNTSGSQVSQDDVTNISGVVMDCLQTICKNAVGVNIINAQNVKIRGITSTNFMNIMSTNLLTDTTSSTVINKAAVTIAQSAEATNKWILYIGVILITIFILIFLILIMAKSKDLHDFFIKMLPILIWLLLSVITTVILVLAKPHFVCSQNAQTKEYELNTFTLSMYLIIFYVVYGIIITVVFKIKNKMSHSKSDSDLDSKYDSEPDSKSDSKPNSNKDLFE